MQDSIRTDLSAGPGGEGADSGPLAFTPSLSPTPSRRELNNRAAVTVDSRSPARRPASSSHWLQSPFQNLEALANMSPDSNLSMSSFCFSSPGRFSPGHVPYVSTATPGINYRMSPETPFTSGMAKELGDELASPLFSPVLFSPYEASARHGHSKIGSANSKLSLVHDFHDVKHSDSPHPDIFSSLSNTGILNSKYSSTMDTFPPGFASYRKAFPELVIPMDPAAGQADGSSDTTAEASASSLDMEKRHLRPGSLSTDSSDSCGEGMIVSPTDISSTPMTRQNCAGATSAHSAKVLSADQRASFFSPAIPTKKNLPHNISPALSENSTPSHCNCKKSKCLKLYCECFAALRYCNSCKCVDCNNRAETEQARQVAIQVTRERNAGAFESKVSVVQGHSSGCNCKKSQCLKKYCECFEGDAFCGENCKCVSCQNFSGSSQLEVSRNLKHRKNGTLSKKSSSVASSGFSEVPSIVPTDAVTATAYSKKYISVPASDDLLAGERTAKRQRIMQEVDEPVYPFFGDRLPPAPKAIALRCLEFLDGKDIYNASLVNHLWCKAAMDNALWESDV